MDCAVIVPPVSELTKHNLLPSISVAGYLQCFSLGDNANSRATSA